MTSDDEFLAHREPAREVYRLSRPPDGRIMCAICHEYMQPEECWIDPDGQRWDLHPGWCATQARPVRPIGPAGPVAGEPG